MTEAVIVSTARTPLCKSWRGALNNTHGAKMGGHVVHAALNRAKVDADEVEDVIMGCANPEGATGWNIARQIAIRAGCPVTVPGMTVNRFCSSGLQTIALAAQRIIAGEGEVYVAGGVESISLVQNEMNKHHFQDEWLHRHHCEIYWPMLQTAEYVARRYEITREDQDQYGVQSQQRAVKARAAGKFKDEIVPITTKMKVVDKATGKDSIHEVTVSEDEGIRPDTTYEGVSRSSPQSRAAASPRATRASSPTAPRPPS
jgi:acetyl-CoA C-acetyltransferase